jgi:hypothetical protein
MYLMFLVSRLIDNYDDRQNMATHNFMHMHKFRHVSRYMAQLFSRTAHEKGFVTNDLFIGVQVHCFTSVDLIFKRFALR